MSAIEPIAIIALIGYALYRQTRVNEVTGRGRFELAAIYTAAGVLSGVHVAHNRTAYGLLAVGLAASLVTGLLRGRRTRMWQADGRIYTQGTVVTVGLFLGLVTFKFVLGTFAYLTHTPYESGIGSVLLMVGVMIAVQAELIWRRAGALRASASDGLHVTA
jgi:hypothetical protein